MNLDRTFCSGLRCPRANTCDRWTENLKPWIEEHPEFKDRPISVAQFGDDYGFCNAYWPIEDGTGEKV